MSRKTKNAIVTLVCRTVYKTIQKSTQCKKYRYLFEINHSQLITDHFLSCKQSLEGWQVFFGDIP